MSLHNAWVALRHGGNLLSPDALDGLPAPTKAPWGLADRLRAALVAFDPDKPTSATLGALLDVVLEDSCGLKDGWAKGSAIGAADAEKLLDGTVLRPRRRWSGPGRETLVVFTTPAARLGVGKGRRPVAQGVEYLRRRSVPLGLVTNGTQWRLVWADTDSLAWAEWEADRWLDADHLSGELAVLRQVLSPATLARPEKGEAAAPSPLLVAIRDTRRGQAKLSKELGERVRRSVETLLRGREPLVGPAWGDHQSNELYVAACHFVMRLVVTLFAEARELLPVHNPVYHQAYGLRGLLDQLDRLTPERRRARYMAWPRLLALFRLLHRGSPHPVMNLPAYGGDLFRPGGDAGDGVQRALALLEALPEPPDDDVVHRILVLLTRTTQKVREGAGWRTVAAPVDFTELTSEYIGILYEGLLDYELHRAGEQPVVFLNLGDQPALPLDRLEAMDDKALKALVEKAKVKKKAAVEGDDEGEEGDDDASGDAEEIADGEEDGDADVEDEPVAMEEDEPSDDARAEARARALAWGRRAVEVAGLVRKPRGRTADTTALYKAQLAAASQQLIADLKLPGELYLVRWGGTRKGAGTFYTRPQLTLPTVRRTLEPLIFSSPLPSGEGPGVRAPEALLSLKVCDPAMGSGSFLVAALRVLTAAVVESLHVHGRIERVNGRTTVACELLPEADRILPAEGFDERLEAIVRRAVVEHCLYGVDIDPLAVELARVALWVETLDEKLPFTFLDHKLRCGDSLVGTWLDRFRDYPLLAFDRQSPDWTQKKEDWKLVHQPWKKWHQALKQKRATAIDEQVKILSGELRLPAFATSDEELRTAVDRVRHLYRELRAVPAGRPDERARIWRERIQTDPALDRVREAFDTWCALWFWPLDQLDSLPLPSDLPAPCDEARAVVKKLRDQKRFFHWELEFPDVFTEEGTGFDAVVGNPPWEIQKPNSMEFFSNHDPLYRAYGKQEALRVQKALFEAHPAIEADWLAYTGDFKDRGNFVKHAAEPYGDGKVAGHGGGDVSLVRGKQGAALHMTWRGKRARYRGLCDPEHPFRHQGSADLNTYKMFVEQAHALLREGGQVGLVVPSGLYTDKGTGELRRLLLDQTAWRLLFAFQNERKFFRDADHRQKQCVIIASRGPQTETVEVMFKLGINESPEPEDIPAHLGSGWAPITLERRTIDQFSPRSHSILEIRSEKDLAVLTKLYSNGVLLGDDGPDDGWFVRYSREFHITEDSKLFPPIEQWMAQGYRPTVYGFYVDSNGERALPLYEGRLFSQFDYQAMNWVSGKGRSSVWEENPWHGRVSHPQYLMSASYYLASGKRFGSPKIATMQVTSATNSRTVIAALTPDWPGVDKTPFMQSEIKMAGVTEALLAVINSLVFDYTARAAVGAMTLGWYIWESLPLPVRSNTAALARLGVRLNAASCTMAPFWSEQPSSHPWRRLWAITPHERLRLRCVLDAIVAVLYGLDRDDFAWVLKDCDHPASHLSNKAFCRQLDAKGFWRVDKTEDPELRHTVLSLAAFDDLQAAIGAAGGDRDAGIQAFCDQNDGDGWMLPETLCLADLGLTRTVDVGDYNDRARTPQPVRSRMGERFLDWQLAQTPEESWAECERHAKTILEGMPAPRVETPPKMKAAQQPEQYDLFEKKG